MRRRWLRRRRRRLRVEAAEGKRKKGRGRGVLRGGGGTGRAPHLSVAAAAGSGGGTAPYPRTPERSRPPTRRPRAAAEATGRERWAGAAAEATAMAFLKLRDQVGEGRRGGIAPTGWKERGTGGPAVWAAWAPSRRYGCEGGWVSPQRRAWGGRAGNAGDPSVSETRAGGSPRAAGGARSRLRLLPREGRVPRSPPGRPRPARCRVCASLSCQVRLGPNRWLTGAGRERCRRP